MSRIELSADEVHEAFVEWLKAHRPEEYASAEGCQSTLYVEVVADELVAAGFEVDAPEPECPHHAAGNEGRCSYCEER